MPSFRTHPCMEVGISSPVLWTRPTLLTLLIHWPLAMTSWGLRQPSHEVQWILLCSSGDTRALPCSRVHSRWPPLSDVTQLRCRLLIGSSPVGLPTLKSNRQAHQLSSFVSKQKKDWNWSLCFFCVYVCVRNDMVTLLCLRISFWRQKTVARTLYLVPETLCDVFLYPSSSPSPRTQHTH